MTWKELSDFLIGLGDDPRLTDRVIVYDIASGETNPCEIVESEDDNPVVSDKQLYLMVYDWGQMSEIEDPVTTIE